MMIYSSILFLALCQVASSFSLPTKSASNFRQSTLLASTSKDDENNSIIDVSDLNLTIADLKKPIPKEHFESFQLAGYQTTFRVVPTNVDDSGINLNIHFHSIFIFNFVCILFSLLFTK